MEWPERITNTKDIQAPGAALANEAENAAKIIGKNYTREPRTIDEARSLENFLVLPQSTLRIARRYFIRVCPRVPLVDIEKSVGNVLNVVINNWGNVVGRSKTHVVVAIKQH